MANEIARPHTETDEGLVFDLPPETLSILEAMAEADGVSLEVVIDRLFLQNQTS